MVVWLLGLSGAGKTTLGIKFKKYLSDSNIPCALLDGDITRSFFDNDLGYSIEDRKQNLKRILYGAYLLEKNGIVPIVCNIHPWEDLRNMAREKFLNYQEVYLKCSIEECIEKDVKGVYKKNLGKTSIIGIDIEFEKPERPDLVLDTESESEEESFQNLVDYFLKNLKKNQTLPKVVQETRV